MALAKTSRVRQSIHLGFWGRWTGHCRNPGPYRVRNQIRDVIADKLLFPGGSFVHRRDAAGILPMLLRFFLEIFGK